MKRVGFVISLVLFSSTMALADFQAGLTAYNSRNFQKAISIWEADAALGDFNAQFNLGALYEQGVDGIPKDLSKSYAWYRLAAAQNIEVANAALGRIKPLLTSGQIEEGNTLAISVLGRWYRKNIGQNEEEYQKILANREAQQQSRVDAEKRAATQRARQQRAVIAQRDADAKLAIKRQEASRAAAIQAARVQAEAAKNKAYLAGQQKAEEERLAALEADTAKQAQVMTAKERLAELKAKQSGGNSSAVIVASTPIAAPTTPVASTAIAKPAASQTNSVQKSSTAARSTTSSTAPVTKTKLPVSTKGMDAEVVGQILKKASSMPVDTAAAKTEIAAGRTDINALKWSLISAARGKAGAQRMNTILVKTMTDAQITEANRQAAEWIVKRQSRS